MSSFIWTSFLNLWLVYANGESCGCMFSTSTNLIANSFSVRTLRLCTRCSKTCCDAIQFYRTEIFLFFPKLLLYPVYWIYSACLWENSIDKIHLWIHVRSPILSLWALGHSYWQHFSNTELQSHIFFSWTEVHLFHLCCSWE